VQRPAKPKIKSATAISRREAAYTQFDTIKKKASASAGEPANVVIHVQSGLEEFLVPGLHVIVVEDAGQAGAAAQGGTSEER
jgi:hypothetical protein